MHVCALSHLSCLTLCDPMDHSLPGSSVHGILQARILEWVVISFSRVSFQPKDWTHVSCLLHSQGGSLLPVSPGEPWWTPVHTSKPTPNIQEDFPSSQAFPSFLSRLQSTSSGSVLTLRGWECLKLHILQTGSSLRVGSSTEYSWGIQPRTENREVTITEGLLPEQRTVP